LTYSPEKRHGDSHEKRGLRNFFIAGSIFAPLWFILDKVAPTARFEVLELLARKETGKTESACTKDSRS
jgi:hypothetical protein